MPAAVAGFVAWLGATTASAFGVTLASFGVSLAVGSTVIALTVASARRMAQLREPSGAAMASAQTVLVKSTEAPANLVYGEVQVGGIVTYVNTAGTDLRSLYYEIVHTAHEIDSFVGWYVDDRFVPAADVQMLSGGGDGRVQYTTGGHGLEPYSGTPVLYLRGHHGTSTQTVDSMLDAAFSDIGANHRHRGCAKTVVRCELVPGGESKWDGGRPPQSILAVIRGFKVYDPRADSTFPGGSGTQRLNDPSTWVWSDNPALIWAHYRTLAAPLGPGWSTDRIDWQSVFDAANACDVLVPVPTASTEKRFRCDLVVDTSMEPREVVAKILATMAGNERHFNGKWHVYAGVAQTADFAFDESDLVGEIQFRKQPQIEDRYNQVKGSFIDRARLWKRVQFVPVNNTALRTNRDNGRVLPKEIELDGVSREYQAQRLAMRALNQADDTGILVFPAGYKGLNIRPGDVGTVAIDEFGWTAKTFRCVGVRWVDFVGAELTLKEDASGNYSDPAEGEYSTRTAAGDIVFGTVQPWYLYTSGVPTFRQANAPSNPLPGWIWQDTDDQRIYRRNDANTAWDQIGANDALVLQNAPAEAGANVTANHAGDIVFRQSTAPASPGVGWVWIDSDDGNIYRWDGSSWFFIGSSDVLNLGNIDEVPSGHYASKPATTSRNSTTTYTDDPHLVLANVGPGVYEVSVFLVVYCDSSGEGLRARINHTGTYTIINGAGFLNNVPAGGSLEPLGPSTSSEMFNTTNIPYGIFGSGFVTYEFLISVSTTGTLSVQWAQSVSSPDNSKIVQGSHLQIQKRS